MKSLRKFFADNRGFTGAEKALLTLLALGLIIVVARFVLFGAQTTAITNQEVLQKQQAAKAVDFTGSDTATQNTTPQVAK